MDPSFTGGMAKLGSDLDQKTDQEKIDLFKSTSPISEATLEDLEKISPFTPHMYYE